jgi:hypothetical protein
MKKTSQKHSLTTDNNEQARQPLKHSQESNNLKESEIKAIEYKNIQQRQEQVKRNQQKTQLKTKKILRFPGIILGAAIVSLIGVILGFSSTPNPLRTKSLELEAKLPTSNLTIKSPEPKLVAKSVVSKPTNSTVSNQRLVSPPPTTKTTAKTVADGWVYLGSTSKASASVLVGKPLIKGSQSINSPIVPSVGSIVTVTVKPGVTLRNNRPQKPNFNPREQKALGIIKQTEKLKVLKVESITPANNNQRPATKVWAQVDRCGSSCN